MNVLWNVQVFQTFNLKDREDPKGALLELAS